MINLFKRKKTDIDEPVDSEMDPPVDQTEDQQEEESTQNSEPEVTEFKTVDTPKKNATRAEDRELFKQLLAGLYDGILIIDSRGLLLQTNQRARDFFGYSEDDLWNINCTELIPNLTRQVIFKIRENIGKNRFTVVNANCIRQDKTQFPAEIAISSVSMVNDDDLVLSVRNCEKRIKAQKANQVRNEAIECAGVGIVSCTLEGNIRYANPAFLKMVLASDMQAVRRHQISDFCPNAEQLQELLNNSSVNAAWHGKMDMITMRDTPLPVHVTSVMTENSAEKTTKNGLIMTLTLMADPTLSATIK